MSDTGKKRPVLPKGHPAKPVSLHPMGEEEALRRILRVPKPPKGTTVSEASDDATKKESDFETGN